MIDAQPIQPGLTGFRHEPLSQSSPIPNSLKPRVSDPTYAALPEETTVAPGKCQACEMHCGIVGKIIVCVNVYVYICTHNLKVLEIKMSY